MSEVTADQAAEAQQEAGTPPPTPKPTPAAKQSTEYLVLGNDGADKWIPMGMYKAASAKAAVSAYVKSTEAKAGTFVAVPARSWQPVKLAIETQQKITLT